VLTTDRAAALQYKAEFEKKLYSRQLGLVENNKKTSEFFQEYLEYSKANKAFKTHKLDTEAISIFRQFEPAAYLQQIQSQFIEKWKQSLKERENTPATVNIRLRTLKAAFSKAVEWKYLHQNPCAGVPQLKDAGKKVRFLSKEEIHAILEVAEEPLRSIFLFFIYTGMRLSELLNLRWEDVDLGRGVIIIQAREGWNPKDYEMREIPIHPELKPVIEKLKPGKGIIFPGNDVFSLNKRFKRLTRAAGVEDFRVHDLRHTFASHLVMNGVDLVTVKELLGHAKIQTTLIYAHLSRPHIVNALKKISFISQKRAANK